MSICFIQNNCVQQLSAIMYLASAVDKGIKFFFPLSQDIRLLPIYKKPSNMLSYHPCFLPNQRKYLLAKVLTSIHYFLSNCISSSCIASFQIHRQVLQSCFWVQYVACSSHFRILRPVSFWSLFHRQGPKEYSLVDELFGSK